MLEMRIHSPHWVGETLAHAAPPSRVSEITPSSLPVQINPGRSGDSATEKIVA